MHLFYILSYRFPIVFFAYAQMLDALEGHDNEQSQERHHIRGPSKMPTGQFVITQVSPVGEPTTPQRVLGPYKSVYGIAVKDHVPVSYRLWTGEQGDQHVVPDSIKNNILWPKILEKFDFPEGTDIKVVKCKTLMIIGLSFKN